ncbi:hypothetical protein Glove_417g44 [Diversispora epigaea]|uniref:Retrotransposon gag domain-containing protein n=1 Tax=Diversispora epigaea TaxID=1348612 RepID=A0A397GWM1_9GLOM|nr:hypothetical protein Glove_417g44 [Diversispora epigaea]
MLLARLDKDNDQNRRSNDNSSWREFNYRNYNNRPRSRPRIYVNQRTKSPSPDVQQIHQEIRRNIPKNSSFFTQSRQPYSLVSTKVSTPSTSAGTSLQGLPPRNSGALTDITEELSEEITDTEIVEDNWKQTHLIPFLQFNREPLLRLPNNINPGENTPLQPIPEENPKQLENITTSFIQLPLKFTGNELQNPRKWIKEFEKAARANSWNANTWKEKMEGFLFEDAEEWFTEANKWQNSWRSQLENFKQGPTEPIMSYFSRFKVHIREGPELGDHEKMRYFKKGLKRGLGPIVSMHASETIVEMVEIIQNYEDEKDTEEEKEPEPWRWYEELEPELKKNKRGKNNNNDKKNDGETVDLMEELTKQMAALKIKKAEIL